MSLDVPQPLLVAPEVSVLAAWREISLGKRKGTVICRRLGTERASLGCHKEISALSLFPTFFGKKIAEMFSVQNPSTEFVPSWLAAETATCGAPTPFYSCDKCQSVPQGPRGLQQEKLIPL